MKAFVNFMNVVAPGASLEETFDTNVLLLLLFTILLKYCLHKNK